MIEALPDPAPRHPAEDVGQVGGRTAASPLFRRFAGALRLGPRARRTHREQLGADLDQPSEHCLALLQLGPETDDGVKYRPREPARGAVHVADMTGKPAELRVLRP